MVVSKYSSRKCLLEQFLKCRGQRRFILTLSGVLTDYGCQKLGIYEGCMSARARHEPFHKVFTITEKAPTTPNYM